MSDALNKLLRFDSSDYRKDEIQSIPLDKIRPNPFQPRKHFDEQKIAELAQSIRTYGLLQPVILRQKDNGYQLVAGERRCLACRSLGWTSIPSVARELNDNAMATIALIENLQRENLHFLEEARGYERLLTEFGLTQEVLAQRLGKSQSTIANKIRLLKLPEAIRQRLAAADMSERHARALLRLTDEQSQARVFNEIQNLGLNVKQAEKRVDEVLKQKETNTGREKKKIVVRDIRIFVNTVRQAVVIMEKAGLSPEVKEFDGDDYFEVQIRLPKARRG
jgi:ParB family chromosome partitioning protein